MTKPQLINTPPFIVVSGASGSGKTTICRKMAQNLGLYYSVSHTTRKKRPSEEQAVDYFFVSSDEFLKMIQSEEFFEWAKVYDNYYGTSKKIIEDKLDKGQGVILDLDTQGAAQIKGLFPKAVLIFIDAPKIEDLKSRLIERATDSSQEIQKRISQAQNEIEKKSQYDYVVLNDELPNALKEVQKIVEQLLSAHKTL